MRLLRRARRAGSLGWNYLRSLPGAVAHRRTFADVRTYCQFLGYPRTGHTLICALLTAHPDVVISNELGALGLIRHGFRRGQVYSLILERDRRFVRDGCRFQGYDYRVPGGAQGRFRRLQVIGDKDGARDATRLRRHPELLGRLLGTVGIPVRVLHVVRNPYDILTTGIRRREERGEATSLEEAMGWGVQSMEMVERVMGSLPEGSVHTIRLEDLTAEPVPILEGICRHIGVPAGPDYLERCSRLVFPRPRKTRDSGVWTADRVDRVKTEMIDRFGFLAGYSFRS
ncbi:MAG: hypothetical protein PVF68_04500 [Acidobacteriota bacterium]|jgi:hypothetical protein